MYFMLCHSISTINITFGSGCRTMTGCSTCFGVVVGMGCCRGSESYACMGSAGMGSVGMGFVGTGSAGMGFAEGRADLLGTGRTFEVAGGNRSPAGSHYTEVGTAAGNLRSTDPVTHTFVAAELVADSTLA